MLSLQQLVTLRAAFGDCHMDRADGDGRGVLHNGRCREVLLRLAVGPVEHGGLMQDCFRSIDVRTRRFFTTEVRQR